MSDARFEDASPPPLRLRAFESSDLQVLSALVQDAVFPASEMKYSKRKRRFAMLINRFRWEEKSDARVERVQSVLSIEDVQEVQTQGPEMRSPDTILSLLAMEFEPGEDGSGRFTLTLAGDGAIALDVVALEVTLSDVTRAYAAKTGARPSHPD